VTSRRIAADQYRGEPNPLQRLILETKRNRNVTYRDIEKKSGYRDDGRPIVYWQTIAALATKPMKAPPNSATIAALARGLDLNESLIVAAIGETMGYREPLPPQASSLAHALAARVDILDDPDERAHILGTMSRLLDAAEARENAQLEAEDPSDLLDVPADDVSSHGEIALKFLDSMQDADLDDLQEAIGNLKAVRRSGDR
jgi:hypothetical protein